MRDRRFRAGLGAALILILAIIGYKFAGGGIGSKQTNLPGPRYFNGHVSESEIYAGAINLAAGDRSIVYLQKTTSKSKGERGGKRLPAAVEGLARKPFRPIFTDNRRVAPTKAPIRRVTNYASVVGKDKIVINDGIYIEVGPIKGSWFNRVTLSVHSATGGGYGFEWVDYAVTMSKGRLVFVAISIAKA